MKHTKQLAIFGTSMSLAAILCLIRSQWERKHFTTTHYSITSPEIPVGLDGYRLVFLSDLHNQVFGNDNASLLEAIDQFHPDLVLCGGDSMITKSYHKCDFHIPLHVINTLAQSYPVIYSNGNHEQRMKNAPELFPDWYTRFRAELDPNIVYLENELCQIKVKDCYLYLAGLDIDEPYYSHKFLKYPMASDYVQSKLGPAPKNGFCILLAHSPLYLEQYIDWGADLSLSGHFHGGTIRLPFLGGLMTPQFQFFCKRDRGHLKIHGKDSIISAGLGTHSINIRLNNLPEIVCITLQHQAKTSHSKRI
ncbi:MAG: metallophosphoesterase [Lachnospiraceae bacterium]